MFLLLSYGEVWSLSQLAVYGIGLDQSSVKSIALPHLTHDNINTTIVNVILLHIEGQLNIFSMSVLTDAPLLKCFTAFKYVVCSLYCPDCVLSLLIDRRYGRPSDDAHESQHSGCQSPRLQDGHE